MCGVSAKVALPQLLEVIRGTDPRLKEAVACTLGNLGTNAAAAVPALPNISRTTVLELSLLAVHLPPETCSPANLRP